MKILKILFVSVLFTLAFSSYTELDNIDRDLDTNTTEDVISYSEEYSQDDGSKE